MTLAARVPVPVHDLQIKFGHRYADWGDIRDVVETRGSYQVELTVRQGEGCEQFSFFVQVTDVCVTPKVATFIGTYEGHDVAGFVFYKNGHHGQLHIATKLPKGMRS